MLFDKSLDEDIMIVPKQPEQLSCQKVSYSDLYCHEDDDKPLQVHAPSSVSSSTSSISKFPSTKDDNKASLASFDSACGFDTVKDEQCPTPPSGSTSANPLSSVNSHDSSAAITRDPHKGAFTFQVHAEYDMLLHVQKSLDNHCATSAGISNNIASANSILRSIDEYCRKEQWMYHVGNLKARAIKRFLRQAVESYMTREEEGKKKFVCVDLGTYCGYSALVLASTLCQFVADQPDSQPFEFQIYTTEISSKLLNVAQSIFRIAKMETYIKPILINDGEHVLSRVLKEDHGIDHIDFLLLDHAKHLYLLDLQDLEGAKLIKANSYVSADNVVFNHLDAYRDHMHTLHYKGVVESRLEEMNLEYSNNLKDGIEMTKYRKDPRV